MKFFIEKRGFKPLRERFMSVEFISIIKYFAPPDVSVGQKFDIAHILTFPVGFLICHVK